MKPNAISNMRTMRSHAKFSDALFVIVNILYLHFHFP